eukprot:5242902-Pyramimonas_sp.AAC.1
MPRFHDVRLEASLAAHPPVVLRLLGFLAVPSGVGASPIPQHVPYPGQSMLEVWWTSSTR